MIVSIAAAVVAINATSISLPGGPPVSIDFFAWDARHQRLWVPAGNTGRIDVIEGGKVLEVANQPTAPSPRAGRPDVGPSSASVGDGVVYVGNRADRSVCAFDAATLARGRCAAVASKPDAVAWVGGTREVWVTTPDEKTISVIDPATGKVGAIKTEGDAEGYAVDDGHGRFYTNLEDKDQTVAIDTKTRKTLGTWPATCGGDGPRGLAIDRARQLLFIACASNGAIVYDLAHEKVAGRVTTGGGVDLIDYDAESKLLFVPSGKDGLLTIARIDDQGVATVIAQAKTAERARAVVVGNDGTAYVADPLGGRMLAVRPPPRPH